MASCKWPLVEKAVAALPMKQVIWKCCLECYLLASVQGQICNQLAARLLHLVYCSSPNLHSEVETQK